MRHWKEKSKDWVIKNLLNLLEKLEKKIEESFLLIVKNLLEKIRQKTKRYLIENKTKWCILDNFAWAFLYMV